MRSARLSALHASLASTMSRASGRAWRTARIRSSSPVPPSFSFSSGRCRSPRRLSLPSPRIAEAQREGCYFAGAGVGRPASSATLTPVRLALEIPKSAVESIQRRAGLQDDGRDRSASRRAAALRDLFEDAGNRFTVARIGNGLAATAVCAITTSTTTTWPPFSSRAKW